MAKKKRSVNEVLKEADIFNRLWEDTIIIALRDLQWFKAVAHKGGIRSPEALLKLDGRAETAIGDAITSSDDRFFIFEFKSDAGEAGSELKKPLVHIMKAVAALPDDTPERALFEEHSRAGHHFVFPELHPENEREADEAGLLHKGAIVATDCYYDAAIAITKRAYRLENRIDIVKMLYPKKSANQTYGLTLENMAAYIEYLTRRYTEWREQGGAHAGGMIAADNSRVPMKALVYSSSGFFWPCADLSNLQDVVRLLQGHSAVSAVKSRFTSTSYPNQLPALKHTFTAKKSTKRDGSGAKSGPAAKK